MQASHWQDAAWDRQAMPGLRRVSGAHALAGNKIRKQRIATRCSIWPDHERICLLHLRETLDA